LDESYVRKTAVDWLANHYQEKLNTQAIVPVIEKYVHKKSRLGNGRVDGLIVSQMNDGRIHTAAVEAKSARTWKNLKLKYHDTLWFIHAAIFAVLIMGLALILGFTSNGGWFWGFIVPTLIFLGAAFAFLVSTQNFAYYHKMDVIQQILRYPADEQWIALSTDVFNMMERKGENTQFLNRCEKKGIGLIRISSGRKITVINSPMPRKLPKNLNDFLDCYVVAAEIRKMLTSSIAQGQGIAETISLNNIEEVSLQAITDELTEQAV
jgi:hypothetical protein